MPEASPVPFVPHFQAPTLPPSAYDSDDGIPPLAPYNFSWPLQRLISALTHAYSTNSDLRAYIDSYYFSNRPPIKPSIPCKLSHTIRAYLGQYPTNDCPSMSISDLASSAPIAESPSHALSKSNL